MLVFRLVYLLFFLINYYYFLQKKVCASKIVFYNNKVDLKAKVCRAPLRTAYKGVDIDLQLMNLNDSGIHSTSTSFTGAFYSTTAVKHSYKIAFHPEMMTAARMREMAFSIQLYLDCFENPYTQVGCKLPRASCKQNSSSLNSNSTTLTYFKMEMKESNNGGLELQCVATVHGSSNKRTRRSSAAFPPSCCPKGKNIICHGCSKVPTGKEVQVTFCPKGFTCLGKILVGGNIQKLFRGSSTIGKRSLNITYIARKLLYRYRKRNEQLNTVEELQALYDLKIIKRSLEVISNDFQHFL